MSYKMVVVIVLLFVFLAVMYREILSIKNDFATKLTSATTNFNEATVNMTNKLQSNMINCVSKMKDISNDNLQQLRKISMLNRQQVTKVSNHFTETDSIDIDDTQCLSAKRNAIFNPKEETSGGGTHLYMSETDDNNTKNKPRTEINNEAGVEIDVCDLADNQCVIAAHNEDIVVVNNDTDSEQQIEVNMNEIIENNIPLQSLYNAVSANNVVNTARNYDDDVSDSDQDTSDDGIEDGIEDDIDDAIDETEDSDSDDEIDVEGFDEQNVEPNGGSSDNEDGVVEEVNEEEEDEEVEEDVSDLKGINDYNIHGLRQVAKDNKLPVTRKNENGDWKTYNKADLYNLIKDHLSNKQTNATN
jgi:hypothetical protein